MTEIFSAEKFFVDAINANPRDKDTRRAYVDWLFENNRPEEAKCWLQIMDKVPAKRGEVYKTEAGWYYEFFPSIKHQRTNFAIREEFSIDERYYDMMTREEQDEYNPFVNLSALVRVMLATTKKEESPDVIHE